MIMKKTEAMQYIEAVGHGPETAEYMLKDLPEPFDMEEDEMPDSVYDTIVDGMVEMAYLMGYVSDGE